MFNAGNLNPYIYTYQNPVLYVDPNGKQTKFFKDIWNEAKQSVNEKRVELANNLVERYKVNEDKIMAYSIAADVLVETTDQGKWVTKVREKIVNVYGDEETKQANEVYSKAINVLKEIKKAAEGNINQEDKSKKMITGKSGKKTKIDNYLYGAAAKLFVEAVKLGIENEAIETTVKQFDVKIYDEKLSTKPKDSGFGGAGASGEW